MTKTNSILFRISVPEPAVKSFGDETGIQFLYLLLFLFLLGRSPRLHNRDGLRSFNARSRAPLVPSFIRYILKQYCKKYRHLLFQIPGSASSKYSKTATVVDAWRGGDVQSMET